jgi:ribosomal protein S12 methylthiotransferase
VYTVGLFTYPPEPGSGAEPLGDPVPAELKAERRARLMELQQPVAKAKGRARRGKVYDALIEGPCTDTDLLLEGRIAAQAPEIDGRVLVNDMPADMAPPVGRIVKVKVTGAHEYDLVARIVS